VVLSEELCILSSCFLSPMSKNSVLEELRVRRLAAINALIVHCMILALVLDAKYCNGILLRLHMSI